MYTEFAVKYDAEKWEQDLCSRAPPIVTRSHNMSQGRMNLKVRKPKKGRKT